MYISKYSHNILYYSYAAHTPAVGETDGAEDREIGKFYETLSYLCHNVTLEGDFSCSAHTMANNQGAGCLGDNNTSEHLPWRIGPL